MNIENTENYVNTESDTFVSMPADFSNVQSILNTEIEKVLEILKAAPIFKARITLAIEVADGGNDVEPILYRTKYTPLSGSKGDPEIMEGQIRMNTRAMEYPEM